MTKNLPALVGYAVLILNAVPGTTPTAAYLRDVLLPAARQGNLEIFFNIDGNPVAFVVWAKLGRAAEKKLLGKLQVPPAEDQLNSGDSLWLLDLVAPFGNLKYVLAALRDLTFADEHRVRYVRRRLTRVIAKEVDRSSCSNFFRCRRDAPWHCAIAGCTSCQWRFMPAPASRR